MSELLKELNITIEKLHKALDGERSRSEKLVEALKWIACKQFSRVGLEDYDKYIPLGPALIDRARQALQDWEGTKGE